MHKTGDWFIRSSASYILVLGGVVPGTPSWQHLWYRESIHVVLSPLDLMHSNLLFRC